MLKALEPSLSVCINSAVKMQLLYVLCAFTLRLLNRLSAEGRHGTHGRGEPGNLETRSSVKLLRHLIRLPPGLPPPCGAILGTSDREETPGQTYNTPERLYISTSMRRPQDPPGGARGHDWGEKDV